MRQSTQKDGFQHISGYLSVIDFYGYWPDFHDAEILSFAGEVRLQGCSEAPLALFEMTIHCFEITDEVDERGYFIQRKHSLVLLRFEDVSEWEMYDFQFQNCIDFLEFKRTLSEDLLRNEFVITLHRSYGLGGAFRCLKAEVVSVTPCLPNGSPQDNCE